MNPLLRAQLLLLSLAIVVGLPGCRQTQGVAQSAVQPKLSDASDRQESRDFVGFDRNLYPGDERLQELHRKFSFAGFWLTPPPGERLNSWADKREKLREAGFGFLVLANGRLDAQLKHSVAPPSKLGAQDAAAAVDAAAREGFPPSTVIFLDQEEGGRLLPEQAAYFFAWTEAVAASRFTAGAYVSGQSTPDGLGADGKPLLVTTAQDVREHMAREHLHPITLWVAQDTCPPAPGCTAVPPAIALSGTLDAPVWQYAQSPRRANLTRSCAATYGADGNCYAGASTDLFLDLDAASSPDPSHGR